MGNRNLKQECIKASDKAPDNKSFADKCEQSDELPEDLVNYLLQDDCLYDLLRWNSFTCRSKPQAMKYMVWEFFR